MAAARPRSASTAITAASSSSHAIGGIILQHEIRDLDRMGVSRFFLPGTPLERFSQFINERIRQNTKKEQSK